MTQLTCPRCSQPFTPTSPQNRRFCSRRCSLAWHAQEWRNRGGDKYRAHLEKNRLRNLRARQDDPTIAMRYHRNYRLRLKLQVFIAYGGPFCHCCGEDMLEFLSLDHIKPRRRKEKYGTSGVALYKKLRQDGFPSGFQVLCMNCNFGKRTNAVCPHQLQDP